MNSDKSWIMNYGSSLCKKRKRTSITCVSNLPSPPWNIMGKVHKIRETKVKRSSVLRETDASSKNGSGGSGGGSNPMSIHLEAKSIYVKKEIPKEDRIWTKKPGCQKCKRGAFETRISKCVTNTVRHHDQDERETDAMHWDVILPVMKGRFKNQLEKEFTDVDWLHCLYLGSIKTRFEICKDEHGELRYIRAIQGRSGGVIISPRLMNYVMIPYKWKRFIYHVGRARDQYSIAEIGLVAGGKERKEGRQTIFFTLCLLNPCNVVAQWSHHSLIQ